MAITPNGQSPGMEAATSGPHTGSLADVLDVILDKGIVIDAFVRVSLVGIEILTLDARVVVASVDTYMHFAREAHRLEMGGDKGSGKQGLAGMMGKLAAGGAEDMTRGALRGAGEGLKEGLLPHRQGPRDRRGVVQRAVGAIRDAITPEDEEGQEGQEGQDRAAPDQASDQGSGGSAQGSARSRQQGRTRQERTQEAGSQRTRGRSSGGPTPEGGPQTRGGGPTRRTPPSSRRAPPRDPQEP